jgi:hypothetical protein
MTSGTANWPREQRFVITADHLKLLRNLGFEYDASVEFGAPCVNPKRPYGNSDVYGDLREILNEGRPEPYSDEDLLRLHKQMTTVLQIIARTGRVATGRYDARKYFNDWKPVQSNG